MFTYTWYQWLSFFYFYCFFGWVFESTYVSILKKRFVNRGFLRIPMLPLYGSGAVMMLWVSLPFRGNLVLTWISGMIGATILEYATGYVMELLFKVRYWDYSDQPFNLNGYICLGASFAWGGLTVLMTEFVHPPIARAILGISPLFDIVLVLVISAVFVCDTVYSVREAYAFGQSLQTLTKLKTELQGMQVQAALLKMNSQDRLAAVKAELRERRDRFTELTGYSLEELRDKSGLPLPFAELSELKDLAGLHLEGLKGKTEQQLADLRRETEKKMAAVRASRAKNHRAILRANPTASSRRFADALRDLKKELEGEGKE